MPDILENVRRIKDEIAGAAAASGRSAEDITLIAASKMNPAERIREAFDAGVSVFGENRVQELLGKKAQGAYDGAGLHFIGQLQRNKVRQIVGVCDLIESVDSMALMSEISKRAETRGIIQKILLEVNIGGEASKAGVLPEGLDELTAFAAGQPGVRVMGIMAIPPVAADRAENRRTFEAMYNLFVDISTKKYDNATMEYLSVGMSGDFADAILAGSNMVRIGSAIFGSRQYQ